MLNESPAIDRLLAALADPARRQLVERLSRSPASVSELARPLPISLPAVLQHLRVLEASGLVRSEKRGRVRTCSLEDAALGGLEDWVAARRAGLEHRLEQLGALLEAGADLEGETDDHAEDRARHHRRRPPL